MKGKGKIDDEILPRLQHSSLCRHDVSGPLDRGRLRARVAAGDVTLGTFIGTASPVTAEVCAAAGFDWLLLDLEHVQRPAHAARPWRGASRTSCCRMVASVSVLDRSTRRLRR